MSEIPRDTIPAKTFISVLFPNKYVRPPKAVAAEAE